MESKVILAFANINFCLYKFLFYSLQKVIRTIANSFFIKQANRKNNKIVKLL